MNIHLYPSDFSNESRIEKLSRSLVEFRYFDAIHLVGCGQASGPKPTRIASTVKIHLLGRPNTAAGAITKIFRFLVWYIQVYRFYSPKNLKCINAHSLSCLPLSVMLKFRKKCVLIYDPHELETETTESRGWRKRIAKLLESRLIKYADHVVVVSDSIAKHYADSYGITEPSVVLNAPLATELSESQLLRAELGIPAKSTIFLYLGVVGRGRGIEDLIEAFKQRSDDSAVLVFMGYGPLSEVLVDTAKRHQNIFFRDAVPPSEVIGYTSSADVGVALIEPVCLSYRYCLPNKLFEYGMAGLPCLVSAMPEMMRYIRANKCGFVIESFAPDAINEVIDQILNTNLRAMARASHSAAHAHSWNVQQEKLRNIYTQFFSSESLAGLEKNTK